MAQNPEIRHMFPVSILYDQIFSIFRFCVRAVAQKVKRSTKNPMGNTKCKKLKKEKTCHFLAKQTDVSLLNLFPFLDIGINANKVGKFDQNIYKTVEVIYGKGINYEIRKHQICS